VDASALGCDSFRPGGDEILRADLFPDVLDPEGKAEGGHFSKHGDRRTVSFFGKLDRALYSRLFDLIPDHKILDFELGEDLGVVGRSASAKNDFERRDVLSFLLQDRDDVHRRAAGDPDCDQLHRSETVIGTAYANGRVAT